MLGVAILLCWIYVSFVLQEQLTNLKVAFLRRLVQRSTIFPEYRESQHSLCFFKNVLRVAVLLVFGIHISFELQEQLTNLMVALVSWTMQRRSLSEYRELQCAKQNTHSVFLFSKRVRGGSLTCLSCERTPRPQTSDPSPAQCCHFPKLQKYCCLWKQS
jgi:hypothetical protein